MPENDDVLVSVSWTYDDICDLIEDEPFFVEHPDKITDELIISFAREMQAMLDDKADQLCRSTSWIIRRIMRGTNNVKQN